MFMRRKQMEQLQECKEEEMRADATPNVEPRTVATLKSVAVAKRVTAHLVQQQKNERFISEFERSVLSDRYGCK